MDDFSDLGGRLQAHFDRIKQDGIRRSASKAEAAAQGRWHRFLDRACHRSEDEVRAEYAKTFGEQPDPQIVRAVAMGERPGLRVHVTVWES